MTKIIAQHPTDRKQVVEYKLNGSIQVIWWSVKDTFSDKIIIELSGHVFKDCVCKYSSYIFYINYQYFFIKH